MKTLLLSIVYFFVALVLTLSFVGFVNADSWEGAAIGFSEAFTDIADSHLKQIRETELLKQQEQADIAREQRLQQAIEQDRKQYRKQWEQEQIHNLLLTHPDFYQIAQSPQWQAWLLTLPDNVRNIIKTTWNTEVLTAAMNAFKTWRENNENN